LGIETSDSLGSDDSVNVAAGISNIVLLLVGKYGLVCLVSVMAIHAGLWHAISKIAERLLNGGYGRAFTANGRGIGRIARTAEPQTA